MNKNIEVEIRAFIDEKKYSELITFFKKEGEFLGDDDQTSYYFDCPQDLRIQKNNTGCKIWLKKGKIHDDSREELEVYCKAEDFENLEKIWLALGYDVEIKWFRKRHLFTWKGIKVSVDDTRGYGHIIELEKMSDEQGKDAALSELKEALASLGIDETPRAEFDKKFEHYRENWKQLV